jgi:hypothetical protein
MALQQINWTQIDTTNVPSGSIIDLGTISGPLHAVYAENLYVSGLNLTDYLSGSVGTDVDGLNQYTASLKNTLELTGSNLTVKGNLNVLGTMTAINSEVIVLGDNIIELNGTEEAFGGLLVKDPTNPNRISGSLLWDTTQDRWVAGQLGNEELVILQSDLDNILSGSDNVGIWRETGSFYATTNDLQVTGSMVIKGNLRVEGTTTLVQTLDSDIESLIVSGAMSVVRNEMTPQIVSASLTIQNLGTLADRSLNTVIDCGDGFF